MAELRKFVETYGHADVRSNYVTEDGYRLGSSLSRVRGDYRRGKLPADRVALLESIEGWTWDLPPVETPVNDTAVAAFKAFVDREGHGAVPYAHHEGSFHLGSYLTVARFRLKKGELGVPQRKALDAVDAAWRRGRTAPDEQMTSTTERAAA